MSEYSNYRYVACKTCTKLLSNNEFVCSECRKDEECVPSHYSCKDNSVKQQPKPPLGIKPTSVWKAERINDLREAIKRCIDAYLLIPIEWVEEHNRLHVELKGVVDDGEGASGSS